MTVKAVSSCWPTWRKEIHRLAGNPPKAAGLLQGLGTQLGDVFQSTNTGRRQASQSSGGSGWEGLVCWYLNACLIGTRAVVIKKPSQWPTPVRDALTVMYGNVRTNKESDLVGIIFPDDPLLNAFSKSYTGKSKVALDDHIGTLLKQVEVCVIQCKTNWNENAQIPMLWDMLYAATGFQSSRATVGVNGRQISDFRHFAYAFVTVPTQKDRSKFVSTGLPAMRLRNLSGGNYWGQPAKHGVAGAVGDLPGRVFSTATQSLGQPWHNHLDSELKAIASTYNYFNI
jgi:hypothetical protein